MSLFLQSPAAALALLSANAYKHQAPRVPRGGFTGRVRNTCCKSLDPISTGGLSLLRGGQGWDTAAPRNTPRGSPGLRGTVGRAHEKAACHVLPWASPTPAVKPSRREDWPSPRAERVRARYRCLAGTGWEMLRNTLPLPVRAGGSLRPRALLRVGRWLSMTLQERPAVPVRGPCRQQEEVRARGWPGAPRCWPGRVARQPSREPGVLGLPALQPLPGCGQLRGLGRLREVSCPHDAHSGAEADPVRAACVTRSGCL